MKKLFESKFKIWEQDLGLSFFDLDIKNKKREFFGEIKLPISLSQASSARMVQYLGGRYCFLKLNDKRQRVHFDLDIGKNGVPLWPVDLVGSITHTKDHVCAVIGETKSFKGVGIDLERRKRFSQLKKIKNKIMTDFELNFNFKREEELVLAAIFSIKESIYKCFYPHIGHYFGFHEACLLEINWERGRFYYSLNQDLAPDIITLKKYEGFFCYNDHFILSLCIL